MERPVIPVTTKPLGEGHPVDRDAAQHAAEDHIGQRLARMLFHKVHLTGGRADSAHRLIPVLRTVLFYTESVPYFLKKSNTAAGKKKVFSQKKGEGRHPPRIQPVFRRMGEEDQGEKGRKEKEDQTKPAQQDRGGGGGGGGLGEAPLSGASQPVHTPICPHRPQVPIPELMGAPFISSPNTQVAMGPEMAEASVGGSRSGDFSQCWASGAWRCPGPGRPDRPSGFP